MNTRAHRTSLLTLLLGIGFSSVAMANLTLFDTYKNTPENTRHIALVAAADLGEPDLTSMLRLDGLSQPPSFSPFTISYPHDNVAEITWNLNGTGFDLLAVYVFGGSNGANLYKITDVAQMTAGSATVHPPVTGNSEPFAGISHTLFLGVAVPEPATAMFFAIGAAGGRSVVLPTSLKR